jgi:predicted O-methyltransferase YrrM
MQRAPLASHLKRIVLRAVDDVVVPLVNYAASKHFGGVVSEVMQDVIRDSADYCKEKMGSALMFTTRERLWSYALQQSPPDGLGLEFGVFEGYSLNFFAQRRPAQQFFGFDSFEGLKEDWTGWQYAKGSFDKGGELPPTRNNVRLIKGWFDETLPAFVRETLDDVSFLHVDSDTYEAAVEIFRHVGPRLRRGAVVVFDEYFGYRGWRDGEFRSWQEFVKQQGRSYEYLAFSNMQVAVRLTN